MACGSLRTSPPDLVETGPNRLRRHRLPANRAVPSSPALATATDARCRAVHVEHRKPDGSGGRRRPPRGSVVPEESRSRTVGCARDRVTLVPTPQPMDGRSRTTMADDSACTRRRRHPHGREGRDHPKGRPRHSTLHTPRRVGLRLRRVGTPHGHDRRRQGRGPLRADRRRGPRELEPARHERRRVEVLPGVRGAARPRDQRAPADRTYRRHAHRLGDQGRLLRDERRPRRLPRRAHAPAAAPEAELQLAGVVQHGRRGEAAVLGLLHQLGRGLHGFDHGPGQDRGHALQVRLGHRDQLLGPAQPGSCTAAGGERSGQLHEGLRRLRRRDQERRQDPPRGQDGDPRRRPSRHRGVHRVQGQRREEGLGADRRRLRRQLPR